MDTAAIGTIDRNPNIDFAKRPIDGPYSLRPIMILSAIGRFCRRARIGEAREPALVDICRTALKRIGIVLNFNGAVVHDYVPLGLRRNAPAGSRSAAITFMKYMCYTWHGTLGHGADRCNRPPRPPGGVGGVWELAPGSLHPRLRSRFARRARHAGLTANCQRVRSC